MKENTEYVVELKKNITRKLYYRKVYKKGTILSTFSTLKQVQKRIKLGYDFAICEGHGVYEYFDIKDVNIVEIKTIITKKRKIIKLK